MLLQLPLQLRWRLILFTMEVGWDNDEADDDEDDEDEAADDADDDEGSDLWYDVTGPSMSDQVEYLGYWYSRTRVASTPRYDSLRVHYSL